MATMVRHGLRDSASLILVPHYVRLLQVISLSQVAARALARIPTFQPVERKKAYGERQGKRLQPCYLNHFQQVTYITLIPVARTELCGHSKLQERLGSFLTWHPGAPQKAVDLSSMEEGENRCREQPVITTAGDLQNLEEGSSASFALVTPSLWVQANGLDSYFKVFYENYVLTPKSMPPHHALAGPCNRRESSTSRGGTCFGCSILELTFQQSEMCMQRAASQLWPVESAHEA